MVPYIRVENARGKDKGGGVKREGEPLVPFFNGDLNTLEGFQPI